MRSFVLVLAAATILAGCVSPDLLGTASVGVADEVPLLAAGDLVAEGTAPLVWEGKKLTGRGMNRGPGQYDAPPCTDDSCERVPFRVELPEGYWAANPGAVEVSIEWEHQESDYRSVTTDAIPLAHYLGIPNLFMHLRVLDADGKLVKDGKDAFHFASIAIIEDLPPGDYIAEVQAIWGSGTYRGVVQVEPQVLPRPGDQMPDLVILTPTELTLEHPIGREGPDPMIALGRKGCDPDEAAEGGAIRCLRFATSFGNLGPGPLVMRLPMSGAIAAIPGESRWMQRIYDDAGQFREEPSSPGSFHKVHGHYHILGLDVSQVYAYDQATQTRGEPAGKGHKTGFCPAPSALIDPLGLGTIEPTWYPGCCYLWGFCQLDLIERNEVQIGLTPGYYDVYPWWRADQYVDIGAAKDGVYELETCANPDGYIHEARLDNNCASVLFRLTGNKVEMLGPP